MKLARVDWGTNRNGFPARRAGNTDEARTYVDSAEYELEHNAAAGVIWARHKATARVFLIDQTGTNMEVAIEPKAPVVPVAPEARGPSRTSKSGSR